jgi:uncharacterized membrane protein
MPAAAAVGATSTSIVPVLGGFAILSAYHVLLYRSEQQKVVHSGSNSNTTIATSTSSSSSWRTSQAQIRQDWSKFVRDTDAWLYAVQTLRNAITANTFLASTVLTLLTVIASRLWETHVLEGASLLHRIQFACIAFGLLRSAYEFSQAARLMTHAGFMFPVTKFETKVDAVLRKSSLAQWLGLRWFYLSLACVAWTAGGPVVFFIAALALVAFFRLIDRVPEEVV